MFLFKIPFYCIHCTRLSITQREMLSSILDVFKDYSYTLDISTNCKKNCLLCTIVFCKYISIAWDICQKNQVLNGVTNSVQPVSKPLKTPLILHPGYSSQLDGARTRTSLYQHSILASTIAALNLHSVEAKLIDNISDFKMTLNLNKPLSNPFLYIVKRRH